MLAAYLRYLFHYRNEKTNAPLKLSTQASYLMPLRRWFLWLTHEGQVAEGAISSVFVVEDQQLLTPPLHTPVLPGITRATVIELAVELGIPIRERELTVEDLLGADEVFLTNSLMEIMPVVRIQREPVGNEKPGELTSQLAVAYSRLVDRECGHA